MWSYFGAKTNLISLYPKPVYGKIIEPFAGSARYALKYFENDVLLVDKYPVITSIWKWLQSCSESDILGLPRVAPAHLDQITFDCEEAKLFYGFMVGCGSERPRMKPTARKTIDRPNHVNYNLQRVAKNLFKIRHWKIVNGSYADMPNQKATWFVDPPYEYGGAAYVFNKVDYLHLSEWVQSRDGQVIVCENTKATWMDFIPLKQQRGSLFTTTEAIWSNLPMSLSTQSIISYGEL